MIGVNRCNREKFRPLSLFTKLLARSHLEIYSLPKQYTFPHMLSIYFRNATLYRQTHQGQFPKRYSKDILIFLLKVNLKIYIYRSLKITGK